MNGTLTFEPPADMIAGYVDGFQKDSPEPSGNRSHCYRHGFKVGRADRRGQPAFGSAAEGIAAAEIAVELDGRK